MCSVRSQLDCYTHTHTFVFALFNLFSSNCTTLAHSLSLFSSLPLLFTLTHTPSLHPPPPSLSLPAQEPLFFVRFFYDLSFFLVVIIIIIQNLIFGVIIDTFADLRAEKNRKEEMLKNTCFICGELGINSVGVNVGVTARLHHSVRECNRQYTYMYIHVRACACHTYMCVLGKPQVHGYYK